MVVGEDWGVSCLTRDAVCFGTGSFFARLVGVDSLLTLPAFFGVLAGLDAPSSAHLRFAGEDLDEVLLLVC